MTTPTTRTYVEFFSDGPLSRDFQIEEVPNRDALPTPPDSAFVFRFFDINIVHINGIEYASNRLNVSGLTYIDGDVLSLDDVKKSVPNNRILLSNMEREGLAYVVRTRDGHFQPLCAGDSVIKDGTTIYPDDKTFPPAQKQI